MRSLFKRPAWVVAVFSLAAMLLAPVLTGFVPSVTVARAPFPVAYSHNPDRGSNVAIVNRDADPGWVPVVDLAAATFAAHGLPLPPLTVTLHGDLDVCLGKAGWFRSTPHLEITICPPHDPSKEMVTETRMDILHELAHAWVEANVDEATRDAFLQLRDVETWNDKQQPWSKRGCEQAATVIARTLVYGERPRTDYVCAFTLLTNIAPPFGLNESCTSTREL